MWSEMIPNENRADYMYMPRMTALAEVLWTGSNRNYTSYQQRLRHAYPRLDAMHVRYRLPDLQGFLQSNVFITTDTLKIKRPLQNITLRYTSDYTLPTNESQKLADPLVIRDNKHLRI